MVLLRLHAHLFVLIHIWEPYFSVPQSKCYRCLAFKLSVNTECSILDLGAACSLKASQRMLSPVSPILAFLFWEWRETVLSCKGFAIRDSGVSRAYLSPYWGCSSVIARERGEISTLMAQKKSRTPLHSAPLWVLSLSHFEEKQCSSRNFQAIGLHFSGCCQTHPPVLDWLSLRTVTHPPVHSPCFSLSSPQNRRLSLVLCQGMSALLLIYW